MEEGVISAGTWISILLGNWNVDGDYRRNEQPANVRATAVAHGYITHSLYK